VPGWQTYTNANRVHDLAFADNRVWTATGGGIVAWNTETGGFEKFTTLNGPTVNATTAVVTCGLPGLGMVFGSAQGLQIFDPAGTAWKVLNSSNSPMRFDDVASLTCSVEHGFLVVGYQQHGLDIFDARAGTWRYVNQTRGLQNDFVEHVAVVGNQGAIWVSSGFGISVLTGGKTQFFDSSNSPLVTNAINAMAVDATGTVWLGGQGTVYRVSGDNWSDWGVYSQLSVLASRFPAGTIHGLAVAADGTLWIGASNGEICHFDPVEVQCRQFFASAGSDASGMAPGSLSRLALDPVGNVYYATDGGGISQYDGAVWRTFTLPDERLAGNRVYDLAQAADGSIWVAGDGGVQQINQDDAATLQLFTSENSGLAVTASGVLQPIGEGRIWFGALGANYFNGANWSVYTAADGLAGRLVQAMTVDNQQRVWLGTNNGISVWNGNSFFTLTRENGLPSADVTALLSDEAQVWIGTRDQGLLRFANNELQLLDADKLGLPSNTITTLAKETDGILWVGTNRGLARVEGGVATLITEIAGFAITAVGVAADGVLWVGTRDNGLLYFDGDAWTQPPRGGKPPSPHVTAILIDAQGDVWVGGANGGLVRYTP